MNKKLIKYSVVVVFFLGIIIISGLVLSKKETRIAKIVGLGESLGCDMFIDNNGVYQMVAEFPGEKPNKRINRPELDGKTFKIINDDYSLDKKNVYYMCDAEKVLEGADSTTFKVYENGLRLSKDSRNVFYNDYLVAGADPDTFTEITSSFHKDKDHVYFVGGKIEGANPKYFKPISYSIGYDNKNIYSGNISLYEIDFDSFSQINETSWKDKNYYYCLNEGKTNIYKETNMCRVTN